MIIKYLSMFFDCPAPVSTGIASNMYCEGAYNEKCHSQKTLAHYLTFKKGTTWSGGEMVMHRRHDALPIEDS